MEREVVMIRRFGAVVAMVEVVEVEDVVGLPRGLDDGHRHRLRFRLELELLEEILEVAAQRSMKLAEQTVLMYMLVLSKVLPLEVI